MFKERKIYGFEIYIRVDLLQQLVANH
jgi:hypothetical protein